LAKNEKGVTADISSEATPLELTAKNYLLVEVVEELSVLPFFFLVFFFIVPASELPAAVF
jgi:hypothetical protein